MDAIGYARISKDEKNSVSIDYQVTDIQRYAEANSFNLVGIEIDCGISGKDIKHRPAFQRVLDLVETKTIDAVIVFKSDRVSRDGLETLQIEALFDKNNVQYLSVSEGKLTSGSPDDEFLAYIRAGLNQRERKLISYRTKRALARKKEKGERISGQAPFGFMFENGKVIPNPSEIRIISRINILKADGFSIRSIQSQLANEGYVNRNNKPLGRNEIWAITKKAA